MTKTPEQKLEDIAIEIQQLKNKKNLLLQKARAGERKARSHRLCKRGGYLESKLTGLSAMTDEQFYYFVDNQLLPWYSENVRR